MPTAADVHLITFDEMHSMKRFYSLLASFLMLGQLYAQLGTVSPTVGWVDPVLNHNRLLREQTGEGMFKMIGPYRVIGSSYLFAERNKGHLYSAEATAVNIQLGYNTYTQEIEFVSPQNSRALVKSPGEVDSFVFLTNASVGLSADIHFIYGKHLGSAEKAYFMELATGPKAGVYKRYKADVGYVSSNYVQSELRQFDLLFDYFLYNPAMRSLKKVKNNFNSLQKELNAIADVSAVFTSSAFSENPDLALKNAILLINQK
jgi:hypothetical protein